MNILNQCVNDRFALYHGDSCEVTKGIPDDSIHYTLFSPPFSSLYTYSNSDRDMGNCRGDSEFAAHFEFLIKELYRITMPGRLLSFHCMNLPMMKERDGVIGLKDFRGDLIRMFQKAGFIYHSEVTIYKSPVTEMQRTKALGLLHKQIKKDSAMSRQGIPDYIVTMRKPGENPERVTHTDESFPVSVWQRYASPVWMDIRQSDTLQRTSARAEKDERHICFSEGTLVLTKRGYVPIETVEVGVDEVLTNSKTWHTVVAKALTKENAKVIKTNAVGVPNLISTPNHKLRAKRCGGDHAKGKIPMIQEEWIEAQNAIGCYLKSVLPPEIDSPISEAEWWLIGRYLADGHIDCRGKQFFISVGDTKWDDFEEMANGYIGHVSIHDGCRQVGLINLSDEAKDFMHRCGYGAANKVIPYEGLSLNTEKSRALFDGYFSGDGFAMEDGKMTITSVSRALLLGMQIVLQKAYGKIASVYAGRPGGVSTICGRKVHTKQEWILTASPCYSYNAIDTDGTCWKKVKSTSDAGYANVWSIEVEEDHSYVAEGCVVKNCPLQLEVIKRCIELWTNPGDIVLDPFAGIGSTNYVALRMNRRTMGVELKESYYNQAVANCQQALQMEPLEDLFDEKEAQEPSPASV